MVPFELYGCCLIDIRDFAPSREAWVAGANVSPHFEARLARTGTVTRCSTSFSLLALAGLLMPIGILSEVYLGLPPVLVLVGAVSIPVVTALLALELVRTDVGGSIPL